MLWRAIEAAATAWYNVPFANETSPAAAMLAAARTRPGSRRLPPRRSTPSR